MALSSVKIACPHCNWQPLPKPYWACSCGHRWNTFATAGVCPQCQYRWPETQCLACHIYSPHEDWYHHLGGWLAGLLTNGSPPRP